MIEFYAAAKSAELGEGEDVVQVNLDGTNYPAVKPTTAQIALMVATGGKDMGVIFRVIESILGVEALDVIEQMIWDRRIDLPDLFGGSEQNPKGLLGQIIEEFRGNPTPPSTESSNSRQAGGRRSTGRSPGKGSIHSPSTSDSSTTQS